jgi:Starter unit:ACP transacylase in aflatoxin biosynthesis
MGEAHHGGNGRREAISVLFGPQGALTSKSLLELRTLLQEDSDLNFLSSTISELPSLWPATLEVWPDLDIVPAKKRLTELCRFFQGGPAVAFPTPTNNILLCPLTVITQIVDFWKLTHGVDLPSLFEAQLRDVQGFCLGFLTAIAVSCSRDEKQFQALVSKVVRLAVCMGALVDLDALGTPDSSDCALAIAVRWKSNEHLKHLQHTMKLYPGVSDSQSHFLLSVS